MIEAINSEGRQGRSQTTKAATPSARGRPVSIMSSDGACLDYVAYVPENAGPDSPLLVCLHGLKRNPAEQIFRFAPYADRNNVVLLAPLFSRGRFKRFQTLDPNESGELAEDLFDATIADIMDRYNLANSRLWLFGFSGGGQFAHRYAMLGRHRLDRLAIVAPGWFTIPEPDLPYPFGTGPSGKLNGRILDSGLLLETPSLLVVSSRDTARGVSLNQDPRIDNFQGRTRLARARSWIEHMQLLAHRQDKPCTWDFVTIEGAKHSFSRMIDQYGLADVLFEWLAKEPDNQEMR